MPLCAEHGQVFGEGSACNVCLGKPLSHETNNLPTQLSADDRNAYEQALEMLNEKVANLTARLEVLEAVHAEKG